MTADLLIYNARLVATVDADRRELPGGWVAITNGLISVEQWNSDFNPTTIRAFKHEGTYVAFYSGGGWVYDPRGEESALTTLSLSSDVRGGYTNPKDGELYIIVGNKIKKF